MSEPGEMKVLADMVLPHCALITNIGTAHIGNLGSIEAIAKEKFQVFSNMNRENLAVIPGGDYKCYAKNHSLSCQVLLYDLCEEFGYSLLSEDSQGSTFTYEGFTYHLPLCGRHQLHNAAGVITLALALGLSSEQIQEGFASFRLPEGRGNVVHGQSVLIDDSYNANPDSMKAAFTFSRSLAGREGRKLVFILGDMKELGDSSRAAHAEIIAAALENNPQSVLLLGEDFSAAAKDLPPGYSTKVHSFLRIEDLKEWLHSEAVPGDIFLVKGSRSMELERVIPGIAGSGRNTCLKSCFIPWWNTSPPSMSSSISPSVLPMRRVTSLLITFLFGNRIIAFLRKRGIDEEIRDDGPQTHRAKKGTPTMGGIMIILSTAFSVILWMDPFNLYTWVSLLSILGFGAVGFVDDYIKVYLGKKSGLPSHVKLAGQFVVSTAIMLILYFNRNEFTTLLYIPMIKNAVLDMGVFFHSLRGAVADGFHQCGEPHRWP